MNEQNIMENNEVMEVAEDVVTSKTGTSLKLAGGALLLGGLVYGGIKLFKKFKARKEEKDETDDARHTECDECEED